MDDQRTHDTLDNLADLFLTGTVPSGSAARRSARERQGAQLDGPPPLRLPPKVVKHPRYDDDDHPPPADVPPLRLHRDPPPPPQAEDDHGEDAAEDAVADEVREPQALPKLHVEVVVLGNLPGFGAPWLTQYAHHLAQKHGPVGLIHVDEPTIDVELVTPPGLSEPADHAGDGASSSGTGGLLIELIGKLSSRRHRPVTHWLLHLVTPSASAAQRLARHLPRWTILSGADDPAVVAAYRLLKQMVAANAPPAEGAAKRVGVMVMGSDDDVSLAAADKLSAAAQSFLHANIELIGYRKQMLPLERHDVGSVTQADAQWPRVVALFEQRAAEQPLPTAGTPTVETPEHGALWDDSEPSRKAMARAVIGAPPPQEQPSAPLTPPPEVQTFNGPELPTSPIPEARPGPAPIAAPADAHDQPELARLLTTSGGVPGGVALDARCPRHPQTTLLLDQQGRLHLLRRASGGDSGIAAAIVELLDAQAWVREHLELLRLTQRQLNFDAAIQPQLHLFASDAKTAATLATRLGATLKLHLLQQVHTGSSTAWVSTELN